MEQIFLVYDIPKEIVAAIMMLYKNTEVKVCSPDRHRLMKKKNGFKLAKERSKRYPAQTITDTDYADDIVHLPNTPAQYKTLLHSLKQAAGGISLHVNADKTEDMGFNRRVGFETSEQVLLLRKLCLIKEKDINAQLAKAWTANDRLSVIWISLTLSGHPSLLSIASGRSSAVHPVSAQSCCM